MGWVVNATHRPLYTRDRPGTHCTRGWVGPRAGLDVWGKSRLRTGFRSPDRPARSELLYRLSYPGQYTFFKTKLKSYIASWSALYPPPPVINSGIAPIKNSNFYVTCEEYDVLSVGILYLMISVGALICSVGTLYLMCSVGTLYFIICRFVCSRAVEIIKAHRAHIQQVAWQKELCTVPIDAMFAVVPYHPMT
jgi:hypothetical protein